MQRYKSLVLPIALILGYFSRHLCAIWSVAVPYVIFAILVLTFSGVKLSTLRPSRFDLWLASFQVAGSIAAYGLLISVTHDEVIAQGTMMCVLCPVASSVTVVATMLGGDAMRTTTYTIIGNLLVAVVAPAYISLISNAGGHTLFISSFLLIFWKISLVIALPFILVWIIQKFLPTINSRIASVKQYSFYLWAFALLVTIGQTADFVFARWHDNRGYVFWLGLTSLIICALQFYIGKKIGVRYGNRTAGGQLLAQKNSAMGIWILNTFLNPVASVGMAYYSIWQNIYNSWQIYRSGRKQSDK